MPLHQKRTIRHCFIVYWRTLLTKIFTALIRAKMRTVSKEVIRFLWLGRVVEKKL